MILITNNRAKIFYMIHVKRVDKFYDEKLVLNIQRLELDNGIYWINGINGSGKTTFLKILAGIIPFNGDIIINDISLKKTPVEYRNLVSYAEAEPLFPPFITGIDLVSLFQDIRKASGEQVDKLITFSGLRQDLANTIGSYSSGMVKRLSLLLAFIGQVPWILLDEPLATLDVEATHALPGLIQEYRMEYGTSFIFSSHQPFLSASSLPTRNLELTAQTIHPGK
jgi:ABC-2 type transport system ATP-binding protein